MDRDADVGRFPAGSIGGTSEGRRLIVDGKILITANASKKDRGSGKSKPA